MYFALNKATDFSNSLGVHEEKSVTGTSCANTIQGLRSEQKKT